MIPKEEAIQMLRDHLGKVAQIRAFAAQCQQVIGTAPDSPLNHHLHLLIDPLGTTLERLISGKADGRWIDWYVWENNGGARGMEAGVEGNIRPIRSVEDLYWVMVEV